MTRERSLAQMLIKSIKAHLVECLPRMQEASAFILCTTEAELGHTPVSPAL